MHASIRSSLAAENHAAINIFNSPVATIAHIFFISKFFCVFDMIKLM